MIERWFLRRFRICSFCVGDHETFDAAVRAGAAIDDLEAAEAFFSLTVRRWIIFLDGVFVLTDEGQRAAVRATETAAILGDPPVPIPQAFLPRIVWYDDADDGPSVLDAQTDGRQSEDEPQAERIPMADREDSNAGITSGVDGKKPVSTYARVILARVQADGEGYYDLSDFRAWCGVGDRDRAGAERVLEAVRGLAERKELAHDTGSMYKRILARDETETEDAEADDVEDDHPDVPPPDPTDDEAQEPDDEDPPASHSEESPVRTSAPSAVDAGEHSTTERTEDVSEQAQPPAEDSAPDRQARPDAKRSKKSGGVAKKRKVAERRRKKTPPEAKPDTSPDFFKKLIGTLRAQRDALRAQLKTTRPERQALARTIRSAERQLASLDARRADAEMFIKRFERGMKKIEALDLRLTPRER